jgi:CRISPR-associated protein Cmr1
MTDFPLKRRASSNQVIRAELELITPMVGGGAVARMVDEERPVNGKTVRGQLRFWWRATRAARYSADGLSAMRRDEAWLFGKAATFKEQEVKAGLGPSRVQVTVDILRRGRVEAHRPGTTPAYASFPLPANANMGLPTARLIQDLAFRVTLTVDGRRLDGGPLDRQTVEADLQAALWAWVTFGGVGARTRRGFGALRVSAQAPTPKEIRAALDRHVLPGTAPRGVPHLSRDPRHTLALGGYRSDEEAWTTAIDLYRDYRQSRRPGQGNKPGRSYWPEPDEIRRLTGETAPAHRGPLTSVQKFPRAALGLPILFHFRNDRQDPSRSGEPGDTTLRGRHSDRLASPVILRPAATGTLLATTLRTAAHPKHPLQTLTLQGKKFRPIDVTHELTAQEAAELRGRHPDEEQAYTYFAPDLPAALLDFFEENLK